MTEPELTLWGSVLTQAIQDLSGPNLIAKSARAWLTSRNTTPGSLIWICDQLGLDPAAVRQSVLRRQTPERAARERSQSVEQAA
jgi:hypothetical protein